MRAWEKNIRRVTPYIPGEQPEDTKIIKLNTNENPYPPAEEVKEALKNIDLDLLRLYPNPETDPLRTAIADYYDLNKGQVFVGVGSDDVLGTAFLTFFHSDKPILFPDITYSFYDVWANLYQIPFQCPPLADDFTIKKEDYYIENGGIVIANPNAPTGIAEPLSSIEDLLQHNQDSVVIVDEAYIDFGGTSARNLVNVYENLLVVQTFSKSRSLAGIRIGFALGSERLIGAMQEIKYSYNSYTMNLPALTAGTASLAAEEYFETTKKRIIETREWMKEECRRLGFMFCDSKANFIFLTHERISAAELFQKLKQRSVYVRYFNKPRIQNYLRVSIGTREEMQRCIAALEEILSVSRGNGLS